MDSGNKIKAQAESFSSIPIPITYYFKSLQTSNYIFIYNTF
jgi:hypothetical protein